MFIELNSIEDLFERYLKTPHFGKYCGLNISWNDK